jgi:hypothetical protein
MRNLNLHARLEHLERLTLPEARCHCTTVVYDDEQPPRCCPHARRWAMVIRVHYDDVPADDNR